MRRYFQSGVPCAGTIWISPMRWDPCIGEFVDAASPLKPLPRTSTLSIRRTIGLQPQDEGEKLCEQIRNGCADRKDYRKIGQFAVQVYKSHYRQMVSAGDVIPVHENAGVLNNSDLYRAETGLSLIVEQGKGEFI